MCIVVKCVPRFRKMRTTYKNTFSLKKSDYTKQGAYLSISSLTLFNIKPFFTVLVKHKNKAPDCQFSFRISRTPGLFPQGLLFPQHLSEEKISYQNLFEFLQLLEKFLLRWFFVENLSYFQILCVRIY